MIRKLFIAALIGLQSTFGVYAQVADLLPMALQQFFDNNGNPLTSGTVTFYVPNTTTLKTTWQDANKAVVNPNPITLNAGGKPNTGKGIYGDGTYRQVVKDRLNNLVWDAVTAPPGASTGTLVGDGNLVGTILPWGGIVAPNQYAFSYGQELNRVTYSDLLTAITIAANVICTNASNTLTGLSDTTQIPVGAAIELTCVPAGTTVVSKTGSTVVLSNPSNISLNTVGTFFPYGNGNGSTTFNVPDLRDLVIAGRPNMGGTDRGLLTTTYYGVNPAATGARGGNQNHTLSVVELAAHTHPSSTLTDPGHIHATTPAVPSVFSGAGAVAPGAGGTNTIAMTVNSATTGITLSTNTGSQGSSTPFATIQPTITLNYIIKIIPDVNSSSASGVASLGGMTGVIACGSGLLCTGNIVSIFNSSTTLPIVSGTAANIILTTGSSLTSLSDGQEFIFTPLFTAAGVIPTIAVDSVAAKTVKGVDGYSFAVYYNIQQGKPLRVRYIASLDVFAIVSPPTQFEDTPFGHGRVKLQASAATTLSISQEDGQGLMLWNATTSSWRMVRLPSITTGNIFSGNNVVVNGVAAQNLVNNKLYSIYVTNITPTNQYDNILEFWQTYSGVGVAAWNPAICDVGIYCKPTVAGGIVGDPTRTFVGTIWTGAGDISNAITPAATMGNLVYAHFASSRWKFGYQTTVVSNAIASAVLTTQTAPAISSVTEAISDSPRYDAKANATCDTAGAIASFRISISGTSFNGAAFTATSPTYTAGVPSAGIPVHLTAAWESAPPMGFYTAKTDIAVSVGSCTFATDILGHLSQ